MLSYGRLNTLIIGEIRSNQLRRHMNTFREHTRNNLKILKCWSMAHTLLSRHFYYWCRARPLLGKSLLKSLLVTVFVCRESSDQRRYKSNSKLIKTPSERGNENDQQRFLPGSAMYRERAESESSLSLALVLSFLRSG